MPQKMLRKPGLNSYSVRDLGRVYGYDGIWGCFIATAGLGLLGGFTLGAIALVPASGGVSILAAAKLVVATAGIFGAWYRFCVP